MPRNIRSVDVSSQIQDCPNQTASGYEMMLCIGILVKHLPQVHAAVTGITVASPCRNTAGSPSCCECSLSRWSSSANTISTPLIKFKDGWWCGLKHTVLGYWRRLIKHQIERQILTRKLPGRGGGFEKKLGD